MLPDDVARHVSYISKPFFNSFVPHTTGTTGNAFFANNSEASVNPSCEERKVTACMPDSLCAVYAKYPRNVEFVVKGGWTFLSEDEIMERANAFIEAGQVRTVDLAVCYAGLGHVRVLAYDPEEKMVYEQMDGGSNDYDRIANHRYRVEEDVESIEKEQFISWWERMQMEQ